jgi:hypothetical protein
MLFGCGGIVTAGRSGSDEVGIQADAEPAHTASTAALDAGDVRSMDEATADDGEAPADGVAASDGASRLLNEVPLSVGDMAFNECANVAFSALIPVGWQSSGMLMSSSGHLRATIATSYGGPPVAAEPRRDILFWSVLATYAAGPYGDTRSAYDGPVGVLASSADVTSASFAIDGDFAVPTLRDSTDEPLLSVEAVLTWVRAYRTSGALTFHVFPGRVERGIPLVWDELSPPLNASFGYYAPISESTVVPGGCGEFNYPAWIQANVTW